MFLSLEGFKPVKTSYADLNSSCTILYANIALYVKMTFSSDISK